MRMHTSVSATVSCGTAAAGFAYWFLQQMLASSFALLEDKLGLDAYDMNSLKMTAAAAAKKNSFAILVFIFFFSLAHCFLELMALQADFSFWRKQRDPSGYFSVSTYACTSCKSCNMCTEVHSCIEKRQVAMEAFGHTQMQCTVHKCIRCSECSFLLSTECIILKRKSAWYFACI